MSSDQVMATFTGILGDDLRKSLEAKRNEARYVEVSETALEKSYNPYTEHRGALARGGDEMLMQMATRAGNAGSDLGFMTKGDGTEALSKSLTAFGNPIMAAMERNGALGSAEDLSKALEGLGSICGPVQKSQSGGPFIGPRGGKYADADHKIPYMEGEDHHARGKSASDNMPVGATFKISGGEKVYQKRHGGIFEHKGKYGVGPGGRADGSSDFKRELSSRGITDYKHPTDEAHAREKKVGASAKAMDHHREQRAKAEAKDQNVHAHRVEASGHEAAEIYHRKAQTAAGRGEWSGFEANSKTAREHGEKAAKAAKKSGGGGDLAKSLDALGAACRALPFAKSGGPYIGPRGGKYADPQLKISWDSKSNHKAKAKHHQSNENNYGSGEAHGKATKLHHAAAVAAAAVAANPGSENHVAEAQAASASAHKASASAKLHSTVAKISETGQSASRRAGNIRQDSTYGWGRGEAQRRGQLAAFGEREDSKADNLYSVHKRSQEVSNLHWDMGKRGETPERLSKLNAAIEDFHDHERRVDLTTGAHRGEGSRVRPRLHSAASAGLEGFTRAPSDDGVDHVTKKLSTGAIVDVGYEPGDDELSVFVANDESRLASHTVDFSGNLKADLKRISEWAEKEFT